MANDRTITAANSILLISVRGLYDVPQRIQGFSADDMFDTDSIDQIETSMGVDGRLSAGWAPVVQRMNVTLQADSPSTDFFEQWQLTQAQSREVLVATGSVVLPAVNRKYAMTRGFLRGFVMLPAARRTLQARRFSIDWERITPSPN